MATQTITDGTAIFKVLDKRMQALVDFFFPVGSIIARDDDDKPEILTYGQWVKIATDRVLQGAGDVNKPGENVNAGLPDITGTIPGGTYNPNPTSDSHYIKKAGAFNSSTENFYAGIGPSSNGAWHTNKVLFNASKSNSIYGASKTVQPPAHIVTFWKRIE